MKALVLNCTLKASPETSNTGPGPGPNYTDTEQAHHYSDTVARNCARNLAHAAKALAAAGPFPPQESP